MKRNDPNLEIPLMPPALPQGLRARLAQDPAACGYFALLSCEQQCRLVDYVQAAHTGEDARTRVRTAMQMLHQGTFTL